MWQMFETLYEIGKTKRQKKKESINAMPIDWIRSAHLLPIHTVQAISHYNIYSINNWNCWEIEWARGTNDKSKQTKIMKKNKNKKLRRVAIRNRLRNDVKRCNHNVCESKNKQIYLYGKLTKRNWSLPIENVYDRWPIQDTQKKKKKKKIIELNSVSVKKISKSKWFCGSVIKLANPKVCVRQYS